jgi:hypothetical protein
MRSFPVFDLQLGNEDYCPCNVVAYSEYTYDTVAAATGNLTETETVGNCTSDRLTNGRREFAAIARASPYISTVTVEISCPESLPAVVTLIEERPTMRTLNIRDSSGEYALPLRGAEASGMISSSAWDDAIRRICFKGNKFRSARFRGMQGRTPPPELAECVGPELMDFFIHSTDWEKLPPGLLSEAASLNWVQYLDNNRLTALPKLDKAPQLVFLSAHSNRLTALPKLDKVPNLYRLDASNNSLGALPKLDKVQLEYLDLSNNRLSSSATWEVLRPPAGHPILKRLDLAFNRLDRIPAWVGELLPSLDYLDVSGNNISRQNIGIPSTDDTTTNAATTAGLLLLGKNPACGGDQGTLPQTMWGHRWNVHCASTCFFTCPARNSSDQSSGWYFSDELFRVQRKFRCDPSCGDGACCVV